MRNGKIYLASNDSFEKFYLAVKGLTDELSLTVILNQALGSSLATDFWLRLLGVGPSLSVMAVGRLSIAIRPRLFGLAPLYGLLCYTKRKIQITNFLELIEANKLI